MSMLGEMTLEEAANQSAGNWESWTCFVWDRERDLDDSDNWAIIYTHNRDSGCLTRATQMPSPKRWDRSPRAMTRVS